MKHFKLIQLGPVSADLLADLAEVAEVQGLALESESSAQTRCVEVPLGSVTGAESRAASLNALRKWLNQAASRLDGLLEAAHLLWLAPGECWTQPSAEEGCRRYCLVLHSPRGSRVCCEQEELGMRPGELWQLTDESAWTLTNDTRDPCVQLLFELRDQSALIGRGARLMARELRPAMGGQR